MAASSGADHERGYKVGQQRLHGSVIRISPEQNMDSRSFFDASVFVLKRNQFGFAVGGPAIKNRLFWFTDYQGTRRARALRASLSVLPSVDTAQRPFRSGRFGRPVNGP